MENQEKTPVPKRLKIAIIILAVLLVISGGGLAARYIYLQFAAPAQTTAEVPDNLIGEEPESSAVEPPGTSDGEERPSGTVDEKDESGLSPSDNGESGTGNAAGSAGSNENSSPAADKPSAPVLELYAGRPDANQRFEVNNMLPGDTETKYFCVKAYHDADITLFFKADVTEQTKSLGDVLHIKVTHLDSGKVLFDAPFTEIDGQTVSELLKANAQEETTAYYQIDVSLDTSVGNEYQAAKLLADFQWYVEDEGGLTPPPQTGDTFNFAMWITLAASSLLLILLLLFGRRRKEDQQYARAK